MSFESAVTSAVSNLQNFETKQKVAYQLAAKTLDIAEEQGEIIAELIDSSNIQGKVPGSGKNLDLRG